MGTMTGRSLRLMYVVAAIAGALIAGACAKPPVSQAAEVASLPTANTAPAEKPDVIKGELGTIGEGEDEITVVKVWGTPYEMGYAHGKLCAATIKDFYMRLIMAMTMGAGVTVDVVDQAWAQMEPFVPERYLEEMRGLADGAGVDIKLVQRAHTVPDLSEFHCTFFAAWGSATPDGSLQQIRALDYATEAGIQDHPALVVEIPDGKHATVSIGWVGFIGVVSGMSEQKIAVSEIGEHFSDEVETLAGTPMPFLMRQVLEEATTLDEALEIFKSAKRTSSFLYCVGDGKIPDARKLRTSKDFCEVYGPGDGDMELDDVVYWSMGTDSKWNRKVHDALKAKHGKIDENVGMYDIMRGLKTGDLHAVHYDVSGLQLWVGNATPGPKVAPGYDQTFVHFDFAGAVEVPEEAGESQ